MTGFGAELTVIVEDRAGNRSKSVTFPLEFDYRAKEEKPADGLFDEVRLGVILIKEWERREGFRCPGVVSPASSGMLPCPQMVRYYG